jgi:hypothetical protein
MPGVGHVSPDVEISGALLFEPPYFAIPWSSRHMCLRSEMCMLVAENKPMLVEKVVVDVS